MSRCAGRKPDGTPCERIVPASQSYCYSHDPERKDERKRNAARAGRSRPNKELVEVKGCLRKLAEDVISGRVDRADAAVAGQLFGTFIRAVSTEIKVKEVLELEERIEQLERSTREGGEGQRSWGA
jgi:hypothetical protein